MFIVFKIFVLIKWIYVIYERCLESCLNFEFVIIVGRNMVLVIMCVFVILLKWLEIVSM